MSRTFGQIPANEQGWPVSPPSGEGAGLNLSWNEVPTGVVNGVNATFTFAHTIISLMLFKDGILQQLGSGNDYTLSGNTVTFEDGCIPFAESKVLGTYSY